MNENLISTTIAIHLKIVKTSRISWSRMLDYNIFIELGATPNHHNEFVPLGITVPHCIVSEMDLSTWHQEHLFR